MRHEDIKSKEQEKKLYRRGARLAARLKIPFPELYLRVSLIREDGSVEAKVDRHSRSIVRNPYNGLVSTFSYSEYSANVASYGDGGLFVKNTATAEKSHGWMYEGAYNGNLETTYGYGAGAGVERGILVGSSSTPESFDDYVIVNTYIPNGVAAGQLQYGAAAVSEGWNAGSEYYYGDWSRTFTNGSGGTVNVRECGAGWRSAVVSEHFSVTHDVFSVVAVANGESIEIEYSFRVNFP